MGTILIFYGHLQFQTQNTGIMKIRFFICITLVTASLWAFAQSENSVNYRIDTTERGFMPPDYERLSKLVSDPQGPYYYPDLVRRFAQADTTLTLEQLHCLYYGYVFQKDYDPYIHLDEVDAALKIMDKEKVSKKNFKKALKLLDEAVEKAPTHLCIYMYRHYANAQLYGEHSKAANDDVFRYVALISVIDASGDGASYESAFHVAIVRHSYDLMNYYGFRNTSQSLQFNDGQSFDVFSLEENESELEELYVNIDRCFSHLQKRLFSDKGSDNASDTLDKTDIPVGQKVTIKLIPAGKGKYNFKIIDRQPYEDVVNFDETGKLFPENGEENTIVLYCVRGEWSSGKNCILLTMKSFCPSVLYYDTYIQYKGSHKFSPTSNTGIFPKAVGNEIWNDPIIAVRIANIRKTR